MALIEVNHRILLNLAAAIDDYCKEQDTQFRTADAAVNNMLQHDYIGPDAMAFGAQWEKIDTEESDLIRFRESLKNYSGALRSCAKIYKDAQKRLYNRAYLVLGR